MPDATGLELIAQDLRSSHGDDSVLGTQFFRNRAAVDIAPARVRETLEFLRERGFGFLASVHGLDYYPEEPRFGVQYELLDMTALDRITVSPDVCGGRPCIRGLRIRVKDVLDLLAAGASREEILADYPYLEPEDITAVLEFAARQNDHPILRTA